MHKFARIEELWRKHCSSPFPRELSGVEIAGASLVMVDSTAAGCISSFISGHGVLDTTRQETLARCVGSPEIMTAQLPDEHRSYFEVLRELSALVLDFSRDAYQAGAANGSQPVRSG